MAMAIGAASCINLRPLLRVLICRASSQPQQLQLLRGLFARALAVLLRERAVQARVARVLARVGVALVLGVRRQTAKIDGLALENLEGNLSRFARD